MLNLVSLLVAIYSSSLYRHFCGAFILLRGLGKGLCVRRYRTDDNFNEVIVPVVNCGPRFEICPVQALSLCLPDMSANLLAYSRPIQNHLFKTNTRRATHARGVHWRRDKKKHVSLFSWKLSTLPSTAMHRQWAEPPHKHKTVALV